MDTAGRVMQPAVRSFARTSLACPFLQTWLDVRADVLITRGPEGASCRVSILYHFIVRLE